MINSFAFRTMNAEEKHVAGSADDGMGSFHEHAGQGQGSLPQEHRDEVGADRGRVPFRPTGRSVLPTPARPDAGEPPEDLGEGELLDGDEESAALVRTGELPQFVLDIKNDVQHIKNELHLHTSQYSVQELRELRELDVRAYELQLRRMERQHEHDLAMERASVERPGKFATRGQYLALLVVLGVLALAAYALYEHEPWLSGVLGAIDLIGLAAVFNSSIGAGLPSPGAHAPKADAGGRSALRGASSQAPPDVPEGHP
jgi:hypothetical protein